MQYMKHFPMIRIGVDIQPISHSILRACVKITGRFVWSDRWNRASENYWIVVYNESTIIYSQPFTILKRDYVKSRTKEFEATFYIPFPRRSYVGAEYTFLMFSENWLGAEDSAIINLRDIELPPEDYVHTKIDPKPLLPLSALKNPTYEKFYEGVLTKFNKVQTHVFEKLYTTDSNVLVGAPTGSGKTIIGELAMLRAFSTRPKEKVVYIGPLKALTKERLKDWSNRLPRSLGKSVVELTGDFTPDMNALKKADLVITTPEKWDGITRHWEHREYVQQVALLIVDEIHLLGQERGPVLEAIICRMRMIASKLNKKIRIVGLSTALANARDISNWLEIKPSGVFNFSHTERPVPITVQVDGFMERAYCPRMATMNKPAYSFINQHSYKNPVLIFVSSRRQTRLTSLDLISYSSQQQMIKKQFLRISEEEMEGIVKRINDEHLQHTLSYGIGMHHAGLTENDRKIVEDLFVNQKIQVLVTTSTLAWGVNFPARLVIVKGTEYYDHKVKGYVDFPITDLLQMIGRAGRPQYDDRGIAYIMAQSEKRDFYQRFLYEPFPVESSLHKHLEDHINAEIAGGTIKSFQDCMNYISKTYFYTRLVKNPIYYGASQSKSADAVNEFLGKLVSEILNNLQAAGCIRVGEKYSIKSTELGDIASFYYISHKTVHMFSNRLRSFKLLGESFLPLLELLTDAVEFDGLPVRHNEEVLNVHLATLLPVKPSNMDMSSPHVKAVLLLLSYFLDIPFPIADFITDTKSVLDQCVRLVQGMIAVAENKAQLDTLLALINILQMIVQGLWITDSPLLQLSRKSIPINKILTLRSEGITHLQHIMGMNERNIQRLMEKNVIEEIKKFPDITIRTKLIRGTDESNSKTLAEGEMLLTINIQKVNGLNKMQTKYGKWKEPAYYAIVGNENTNEIIRMVRFALKREAKLKLTFDWPEIQKDAVLKMYLMTDSFIGLDQVITLRWEDSVLDSGSYDDYKKISHMEEEVEPGASELLTSEYSEPNQIIEKDVDIWS